MLTWLLSLINLTALATALLFAYESRREKELKAWKIGMGAAGFHILLGLAILFLPLIRIPAAWFFGVILAFSALLLIPPRKSARSLQGAAGYLATDGSRFEQSDEREHLIRPEPVPSFPVQNSTRPITVSTRNGRNGTIAGGKRGGPWAVRDPLTAVIVPTSPCWSPPLNFPTWWVKRPGWIPPRRVLRAPMPTRMIRPLTTIMAQWFGSMGYRGVAEHNRHYDLLLVPLAIDAGLGELGTPRGTSFPTDTAPGSGSLRFRPTCPWCRMRRWIWGRRNSVRGASNAPNRALPVPSPGNGERPWSGGLSRWKLNEDGCFDYWGKVGDRLLRLHGGMPLFKTVPKRPQNNPVGFETFRPGPYPSFPTWTTSSTGGSGNPANRPHGWLMTGPERVR